MRRPILPPATRRAGALVAPLALLLVAASCSGTTATGPAAAPGTTGPAATTPTPVGARYEIPPTHASDWGAPPVTLPDAPRPYGPSPVATADPAFYDVTTLDAGEVGAAEPGTVLRSQPVELTGPLAGGQGWRVLYRSTTADGKPAVVSGMVLVPNGPAPAEGRAVVAWAHGTTGIADRCAPSATGNLFYDDYGQEGRRLLDLGYVVAATDYHGLGTPGVHSYHNSEELARATIDSVAAAHRFGDAGPLRPDWFVIGHSEGGLAALAVDERVATAPAELRYRGAVAQAPSAQLGKAGGLMFAVDEARGYAALLLEALAETEPRLAPAVALKPAAAAREPLLTHGCWEEAVPGFDDLGADGMLVSPEVGDLLGTVLTTWAGNDPQASNGPLLVVQGEADEGVPPPLTADLVRQLCAAGVPVTSHTYPGVGHDAVVAASADDVAAWMATRFAAETPPSTCTPG